jgi:succinate dehydrogenase / fumarate reductase membrane anchor subunit
MRLGKTGQPLWLLRSTSATGMAVFFVFVIAAIAVLPLRTYTQWHEWVAGPLVSLGIFIFFAALLTHVWLGLREVALDYAQTAGLRRMLLGLLAAGLLATAAWVAWILIRVQS